MWQLLNGATEVLVDGDFLWVPLLFDPEVADEVDLEEAENLSKGLAKTPTSLLRRHQGRWFIRSLTLTSLVEQFQAVYPEAAAQVRRDLLQAIEPRRRALRPVVDATVQTILFEVMPYFLRTRRGWQRQSQDKAAILAYLAQSGAQPTAAAELLADLRQQEAIRQEILHWLETRHVQLAGALPPRPDPPELAQWFTRAVQVQILEQEMARYRQELAEWQRLQTLPEPQLLLLLAVAQQGALEVDGVGFLPDPKLPGGYLVYKRTGDFALQDYYGRPYFFPDCRVAVSTLGPFQPVVLDHYKHPLLRRHAPRQPICLTDYQAPTTFSAAGIIQALQEGLNALYYGYNARKRNGYNSLDTYGRDLSVVSFADRRLPADDPRLVSGLLEVKNR